MRETASKKLIGRIPIMRSADAVLFYLANIEICTAYKEVILVFCQCYDNTDNWALIQTKWQLLRMTGELTDKTNKKWLKFLIRLFSS